MDLVVCIITSRVRERLAYYGEHGVVLLVENTFSFLTKGSLVDCNQAMLVPKAELPQIIDEKEGFSIKTRDLADDFLKEILIAIEGSDVAKKDIKTAVKNSPMSSRLFPNTR